MNETQHIASAFDRDLEAVQAMIMKMGGLVEAAILDSVISLEKRDPQLAQDVRRGDRVIDTMEERITEEVARVIALRVGQSVKGNCARFGNFALCAPPDKHRLAAPRHSDALACLNRR